jgi:hypothetical protein
VPSLAKQSKLYQLQSEQKILNKLPLDGFSKDGGVSEDPLISLRQPSVYNNNYDKFHINKSENIEFLENEKSFHDISNHHENRKQSNHQQKSDRDSGMIIWIYAYETCL